MAIKANLKPPTSAEELQRVCIPHLRTQFKRAQPILFTGAGFSVAARNSSGETLPTYAALQKKLWDLCFPGETFEDSSPLQHLFEHALIRHRNELGRLLTNLLSVDANALPNWYQQIFSFPWFRCYTLNIDDLAAAADRAFDLPRRVRQVSATNPNAPTTGSNSPEVFEVIHLNGTLDDLPDHVTFSLTQFAERLSKPDPWYTRFVVDLLSHPIVIIGTRLDEPPLWQHLASRREHGHRQLRELRPRSYLVTPHLDKARKALLAEFNIRWVQMTGEQFTTEVLSHLHGAQERGLQFLKTYSPDRDRSTNVPDVADLVVNPTEETEFLLGSEPIWADLQSGRAIRRDSDDHLWSGITSVLQKNTSNLIVVTGTAGSGKSTALMRVCLKLMAQGERVGWIDRDSDLSPRDIRRFIKAADAAPRVLAIDDADVYGPSLASMVRDLLAGQDNLLVLVALRSGKVDRTLNPSIVEGIAKQEFAMPPLTDGDIDGLLSILDEHNRLGALKGKSVHERREVLRRQCGRQLLVAMIEATSGRKFEEKAIQELTDLENKTARIYALIAVAHAFRFPLQRDEILLATGDASNESLNIVRQLLSRHIVAERREGYIQARHRVIAELLHDEFQKQGMIASVLSGLAFLAASKVRSNMHRSARPWRMLRQFINHDYLLRSVGLEQARNLYGQLESMLRWDFHYWLQYGSLEVEEGDLRLALQFLNQARSITPDDPFVENEWAYLLFRQAIEIPGATNAQASVDEATTILEDLIDKYPHLGSHPYHVLGSQGLSWSRRGIKNSQKKGRYLQKIRDTVEAGIKKYPTEHRLEQLLKDIQREYLEIAVTKW